MEEGTLHLIEESQRISRDFENISGDILKKLDELKTFLQILEHKKAIAALERNFENAAIIKRAIDKEKASLKQATESLNRVLESILRESDNFAIKDQNTL